LGVSAIADSCLYNARTNCQVSHEALVMLPPKSNADAPVSTSDCAGTSDVSFTVCRCACKAALRLFKNGMAGPRGILKPCAQATLTHVTVANCDRGTAMRKGSYRRSWSC
jgi:hypothetical protein